MYFSNLNLKLFREMLKNFMIRITLSLLLLLKRRKPSEQIWIKKPRIKKKKKIIKEKKEKRGKLLIKISLRNRGQSRDPQKLFRKFRKSNKKKKKI